MKSLLFLLLMGTTQAFACEEDLLFLLAEARQSVINNFTKGEPCYNAALLGRTQGLPGCFPPGAFRLQSLLKPIFTKASVVCKQSCEAEGKIKSCQKLLNQDYLKKVGIDLLINSLRTTGLTTEALYWDGLDLEGSIEI